MPSEERRALEALLDSQLPALLEALHTASALHLLQHSTDINFGQPAVVEVLEEFLLRERLVAAGIPTQEGLATACVELLNAARSAARSASSE